MMLPPRLTHLSSGVLASVTDMAFAIPHLALPPLQLSSLSKQSALSFLAVSCLLLHGIVTLSLTSAATISEDIFTNHIGLNENQILTYLNRGSNLCPKWLNCTESFFNEGKDCHDSSSNRIRCNCIAHCCMAFDCRDWGNLVQCRRKCGAQANRFGLRRTERLDCEKYHCERNFFDPNWDARGASEVQRNCIAHCCYAFDCRRTLGYCRHACGVDAWVTARPLGR